MKVITLLPADSYKVYNQTLLNDNDKKIIMNLYGPIIGMNAVSLFFALWSDLDKNEMMSDELTHHHLMTMLKSDLDCIKLSRKSLEAVGLLKSYLKVGESVNEYIYELYSPLNPKEFLTHPVLSVILYNNIGEKEFNKLVDFYKRKPIDFSNFVEVSASINKTYKSVCSVEANSLKTIVESDINIEKNIDFDMIVESLPNNLMSPRALNRQVKDLINSLSFVYDLDTLKMVEILRLVIDDNGMINKNKLISATRKYYEFNNNGNLPTLIYRTQAEHLKSPIGDNSDRARMQYIFENTSPYDYLRKKYRGATPTSRDVRILEFLAVELKLKPGVINVLIDYVLRVNDNKLNRNFIETIAGQWARLGFSTVEDAMKYAEKEHKKVKKKMSFPNKKSNEEILPVWFNDNNLKDEITEEEKQKIEALLNEVR